MPLAATGPDRRRPPSARVVEDDVEQHLDARRVQRPHHRLELDDRAAGARIRRVFRVRREEPQRVVAPVVPQPELDQALVVHEVVHRQQLHGRHPEPDQVLHRRRMRQPRVGPPQRLRYPGMPRREALHVQLVDHGLAHRPPRRAIVPPVEAPRAHDRPRDEARAVEPVPLPLVVEQLHRRSPLDLPLDRARVRIDEQLRRIAQHPPLRLERPMDPEPVPLPDPTPGEEAMPDPPFPPAQPVPRLEPLLVEQTQLHPFRHQGEHGEPNPTLDGRRAQRIHPTRRQHVHAAGTLPRAPLTTHPSPLTLHPSTPLAPAPSRRAAPSATTQKEPLRKAGRQETRPTKTARALVPTRGARRLRREHDGLGLF